MKDKFNGEVLMRYITEEGVVIPDMVAKHFKTSWNTAKRHLDMLASTNDVVYKKIGDINIYYKRRVLDYPPATESGNTNNSLV